MHNVELTIPNHWFIHLEQLLNVRVLLIREALDNCDSLYWSVIRTKQVMATNILFICYLKT